MATPRAAFIIGALFGLLSVAAGAFGAHALKERLDTYSLGIWNTAAQYQMYHALALLLVAAISTRPDGRITSCIHGATWCFAAGVLIFSGTLYALALSGVKWLGAITPIGGALLIAGWVCLVVYGVKCWRT